MSKNDVDVSRRTIGAGEGAGGCEPWGQAACCGSADGKCADRLSFSCSPGSSLKAGGVPVMYFKHDASTNLMELATFPASSPTTHSIIYSQSLHECACVGPKPGRRREQDLGCSRKGFPMVAMVVLGTRVHCPTNPTQTAHERPAAALRSKHTVRESVRREIATTLSRIEAARPNYFPLASTALC